MIRNVFVTSKLILLSHILWAIIGAFWVSLGFLLYRRDQALCSQTPNQRKSSRGRSASWFSWAKPSVLYRSSLLDALSFWSRDLTAFYKFPRYKKIPSGKFSSKSFGFWPWAASLWGSRVDFYARSKPKLHFLAMFLFDGDVL